MQFVHGVVCGGVILAMLAAAGTLARGQQAAGAAAPAGTTRTLRDAAGDRLLIGAAVSPQSLDDPRLAKLLATHFSSLTAENVMKPDALQRQRGEFTFEHADKIADFARK